MGLSGVTSTGSRLIAKGGRLMTIPSKPLYREIPLTQGQVAIVDAKNYALLVVHQWHAIWNKSTQSFYAVRNSDPGEYPSRTTVRMHREIKGLRVGDAAKVDHKEPSKTLLNTEGNLRIANSTQSNANQRLRRDNTTGFKGVFLSRGKKNYVAIIRANRIQTLLGYFPLSEEGKLQASMAYQQAAKERFGEFARTY